jgi:hypothetical protein
VDHVTDESSGHVTGRVEEELYLPLYRSYITFKDIFHVNPHVQRHEY